MPVKTLVTTSDPEKQSSIVVGNEEILTTLDDHGKNISLQLQEIFESIQENIGQVITSESRLTIEMTGEASVKACGGINYLFFKIGGDAGSKNSIKVALTTTLMPRTS